MASNAGIPAGSAADVPVSGNLLEAAGAGVEGFARGLTAGTSDVAAQKVGGLTGSSEQSTRAGIESRKGAFPKTSGTGEFIGESMRNAAAMALAGPAGLFVNGALNVAGESADLAYNHDPRLTREHVTHKVLSELVSSSIATAAGPVLGAAGKYLKKGGLALGEAALEKSPQLAKYTKQAGKSIDDLVEQAYATGVFSKSRAAAAKSVQASMEKTGAAMENISAMADQVHAAGPGVTPQQILIGQHLAEAADKLKVSQSSGVVSDIRNLLKASDTSELKPSELLRAEQVIKDAQGTASAAKDSYTYGVLSKLRRAVEKTNDSLLQGYGINAAGYRDLQMTRLGQQAVLESIPKSVVPGLLKRAAAGAGTEYLSEKAGLPRPLALGLGAAVAGGVGGKAPAAGELMAAGKSVAGYAGEKAFKVGAALTEFDKGTWATWLGEQLGAQTQEAVREVARGPVALVAKPSADKLLAFIQQYGEQPDYFHNKAAEKLDSLPLPQAFKDVGDSDLQMAMGILQQAAPAKLGVVNPFSPPVARTLTHSERYNLVERAHGLMNPIEALKRPSTPALEAVRQAHPATYEAYIGALLQHTGINTKASAHVRRNIEALGLDVSTRQAGAIAQVMHASKPPPPPGPKSHHTTSEHTSVKVDASQTHTEGLQSGE